MSSHSRRFNPIRILYRKINNICCNSSKYRRHSQLTCTPPTARKSTEAFRCTRMYAAVTRPDKIKILASRRDEKPWQALFPFTVWNKASVKSGNKFFQFSSDSQLQGRKQRGRRAPCRGAMLSAPEGFYPHRWNSGQRLLSGSTRFKIYPRHAAFAILTRSRPFAIRLGTGAPLGEAGTV